MAKRELNERTNFLPIDANDTLIVDQDSNEIQMRFKAPFPLV